MSKHLYRTPKISVNVQFSGRKLEESNILQLSHTISACFWAVLLCPLSESFRHPDNCPNGSCCGCHAMIVIWLQSPVGRSFLWRFSDMQVRSRGRFSAAMWHKMTCGTSKFGGGRHSKTPGDLESGKLLTYKGLLHVLNTVEMI